MNVSIAKPRLVWRLEIKLKVSVGSVGQQLEFEVAVMISNTLPLILNNLCID